MKLHTSLAGLWCTFADDVLRSCVASQPGGTPSWSLALDDAGTHVFILPSEGRFVSAPFFKRLIDVISNVLLLNEDRSLGS